MKRRRLFSAPEESEPDVRPSLLGVVTLLFLLLFFLLATSSGQRLGTIGLRFGNVADLAPLPHVGLLQNVEVVIGPEGGTVRAEVQTTDIAASATSVEVRTIPIPRGPSGPDLAALDAALAGLHALDPAQQRATVSPADGLSTASLVAVLDAVRGPNGAERFPELTLAGIAP